MSRSPILLFVKEATMDCGEYNLSENKARGLKYGDQIQDDSRTFSAKKWKELQPPGTDYLKKKSPLEITGEAKVYLQEANTGRQLR